MFLWFLFYLSTTFSLIQKVEPNKKIYAVMNVFHSTVVLTEAEVVYRNIADGKWFPLKDQDVIQIIQVLKNNDNSWNNIQNKGRQISLYTKDGTDNSFFFTTPSDGWYAYVFEVDFLDKFKTYELGIDTKIYVGRQSDPIIQSQTDTIIKGLSTNILNAYNQISDITRLQRLDELIDMKYESIIHRMKYTLFIIFALKIITFGLMYFKFNKSLRSYFVNNKIVNN